MIAEKSTGYTLDRETLSIRFERTIDASASEVFDAWTNPAEVTAWWDPDGEPLVTCAIDLRVGGSFSFATRQHSEMPFTGVYREITPPRGLVFEAMGSTGRVVLNEVDGGTHMLVEILCSSAEQLEQFAKMGVAEGTSRTLDNLVAFVGER
ncbi:MAG TPA: SRPBCC domain-containing protein [Gemmatimonadaceae bacterium]|nr:SRPBCC domain-containing protein [Gemmatimonadaceae bacterium]